MTNKDKFEQFKLDCKQHIDDIKEFFCDIDNIKKILMHLLRFGGIYILIIAIYISVFWILPYYLLLNLSGVFWIHFIAGMIMWVFIGINPPRI